MAPSTVVAVAVPVASPEVDEASALLRTEEIPVSPASLLTSIPEVVSAVPVPRSVSNVVSSANKPWAVPSVEVDVAPAPAEDSTTVSALEVLLRLV